VAVNVLSQEKPAELLYTADENFRHPVTQSLPGLPAGFTPLASQPGGMALDRAKHQMMLHGGVLAPGDSVRVQVAAPVQLGNQGGLITLLNPDGLKVDGVAYTQAQADVDGWSIVF
jgi:Uncharacterized conserved protein (DUF2278)